MTAVAASDPDMASVPPGAVAQTGKRSILDLAFSFPVMVAATLVVLTVLTVRSRFNDPDLWFHLKIGEVIWNTHSIPRTDQFSFTTNSHARTDHEWLSEVAIYGAWKFGGNAGLMLWFCVLASLLFIAAYTLCSLYSGNAKVALIGALVTWLFATVGLAVRPHMLGYLLLLCELLILELGRKRDPRWFYALPPLFALWINFHGSFVFGFVVLAVILGCAFLQFEWGLVVARRWPMKTAKTLAIATGLSGLALFLNPIGPRLIWYPL